MNNLNAYDRPGFFYLWSFLIPCACWLAAGYISHTPGLDTHTTLQGTLGIIGLAAPTVVAAWLFLQKPVLFADLKPRLSLRAIRLRYLLAAVFIGPVTLVLAQLVSLAFGYSAEQFRITGHPSFTSALFSPWLLLVLAPLLEELAWHSYGTDVLLARFRLPYHLSALTQAAALAALSHREELMSQVASLRAERDALVAWLRERGLTAHDSDANFVLFGPFEDRDAVWRSLLERGILIRVVGPEGYLRVSIGTPEEMDAFRTALAGVLTADANEGAGRSSRNSKQDNEEKSA